MTNSFQTFSSQQPLGQSKQTFNEEPPLEGGMKFCIDGTGHMTRMAATLKTFKNLISQNQKVYDLETLNAALRTQALQICINDDPWLNLTN